MKKDKLAKAEAKKQAAMDNLADALSDMHTVRDGEELTWREKAEVTRRSRPAKVRYLEHMSPAGAARLGCRTG